ncbi:unnamed protein product [Paramecium sonneborni]|uniref:Uncharacterized protein n=1 Tax=Paramecium sonneborni TaxID=65129 RepID=A0A8S1RJF1_9CILI|nr:unnamed protein product [Paramecium sonneborni]
MLLFLIQKYKAYIQHSVKVLKQSIKQSKEKKSQNIQNKLESGTGCQDSATTCSGQSDIQCYFGDQEAKQECYWTGTECVNKTCDKAPTDYRTHEKCQSYNKQCTTNDAGCRTITACADAKSQEGCKINNLNQLCYQGSGVCVDYICDKAPTTNNTNTLCDKYKPGCVTKKGGGLTLDEEACYFDKNGGQCVFNVTCKEKTCPNAPINSESHDACTQYKDTCTVNANNKGCRDRQCDNAPLNKSKCIPKKGGGCQTHKTCDKIDVKESCVKDSNGKDCTWDDTLELCLDKTCANAPADKRTSHQLCQSYMSSCTVNVQKNACIDMICENIVEGDDCKIDKNGEKCKYKGTCYLQECRLASQTITTYTACQSFMDSCTLDNSGKGCMPIPPTCGAITTQEGCVKTSSGSECAWASNRCQDKTCSTAPTTTTDNDLCNTYKSNCLVNNTANGCFDPTTYACTSRQNENNCYSAVGLKCVYSPSKKCQARSCDTASDNTITLPSSQGYLTTISNSDCDTYLTGCICNNAANGCRTKANACSDYNRENCSQQTSSGKSCYLNSDNTCVDLQCEKIKLTTHPDCDGVLGMNNTCTVAKGASPTNCMTKLESCGQYEQNQCKSTKSGKTCIWASKSGKTCIWATNSCREATCSDATDTSSYQDHLSCNNYVSTCTVIERVDNKGCIPRKANCSDYTSQPQCVKNLADNDCYWNGNNSCVTLSTLTCAQIVLGTYNIGNCQNVKYSCKANTGSTACENKVCADYTKTDGKSTGSTAVTTFAECKGLDPSCTIDNATSDKSCMTRPTTCTSTNAATCTFSDQGQCVMQGANCIISTALCSSKTGTNLTYQDCQTFNNNCSVNLAGTACVEKLATCAAYTLTQCRKSTAGLCKIDTTCVDIDSTINCALIVNTGSVKLTYQICQDFSTTCSVKNDGSACIARGSCTSYGTTAASCVKGSDATCIFKEVSGTDTCVAFAGTDCASKTGSANDYDEAKCQFYHSDCYANSDGSACYQKKTNCSDYTTTGIKTCLKTSGGAKCYWYAPSSGTPSCIQITTASTDCSKVTGASSSLSYSTCQGYNTGCSVNSTGSACEAKSCTNKPSPHTHIACSTYSSTCAANKVTVADACKIAPNKCSDVAVNTDCIGSVTDGECEWIFGSEGGTCVKKTCYTKISSIALIHSDCTTYLSSCKAACNTYLSSEQCTNGGNCFWNSKKAMTCVDRSCDKIEDAYNTHALCSGINGLTCTVKSTGVGCQSRQAQCSSYNEKNCIINQSGWECVLVTQEDGTNKCMEKACITAGSAYTDYNGCYNYFKLNSGSKNEEQCTVAIVTATDGTESPQGCQKVQACTNYKEAQCYIDSGGKTCVWDATAGCRVQTCDTAPNTESYDTDEKCKQYLADGSCTVADDDMGCIVRPDKCEGMTEKQCIKDKAGKDCQYLNGACYTKSCSTAPAEIDTKDECVAYFPGCTMDETSKCKLEICEDFIFTTDDDCQKQKQGCTTNGTKCVLRTTCSAVTNEKGCVTERKIGNNTPNKCQWLSNSSTCVVRTCDTAPVSADYDTEAECIAYLPGAGCTTKRGGGCVKKSTCANATHESACNTGDIHGNQCKWDVDKCRDQVCQDFTFSTHAECQKASNKLKCTAGPNGKCTNQLTCEDAVRAACIEGIYNGVSQPCLWIEEKGRCFKYLSCQSLEWDKHEECQYISNQCTVNQNKCQAITLCSETNTNGGCKVGYDGPCIKTVPAIDSNDLAVCKAYTSCADAFYKTHTGCNDASDKCTTNGATSCAPLGTCSLYTIQEACVLNNVGAVYDKTTGEIISTGNCAWEGTQCIDQTCKYLVPAKSHQSCYNQLKGCTSDGANCISIAACATYTTEVVCITANGSDGPNGKCLWDPEANNKAGGCRVFQCSDIKEVTSTPVCQATLSTCVSNGTACIEKANCNSPQYQNKISCNSGGKDGICIFTKSTATGATENQGTCALMTSCDSAKNDSKACTDAKNRCSWTPQSTAGTTTVPSKCQTHSCATYRQANGNCGNFYSWDFKTQQVCVTEGSDCKEKDPSTLSQDLCYTATAYAYTWNASTSKCAVCTAVQQNNNTTTNPNTTTTPNNTDDSGYILGFTTVILGYLVF